MKFKRAAWTYLVYGVIYWLTALYLQLTVFPARGPFTVWFGLGALLAMGVPWLLFERRPWFERWVVSRRDLARILAALVALRAVTVARIAVREPEAIRMPSMGGGVPPNRAGAWMMAIVAVITAIMLARAAWADEERS